MPLIKQTLQTQLIALFDELKKEKDQQIAITKFATDLSTMIDNYIKTATVIGTSPSGPVTGNLT